MIENRTSVGKSAEDFIRLQDLWGMFFQKWYWFALSLFVALATASLYLLSTPNVYTRTAAILVKDDSKNNSSASAMNEFADMGIFKSNTNLSLIHILLIGGESNQPEMIDTSVVLVRYSMGRQTRGTLGVIGPTRMDYPKIVSNLQYLAQSVGGMLNEIMDVGV